MTRSNLLKRIHSSIFVKLLLVFLGSAFVILGSVRWIKIYAIDLHDRNLTIRDQNRAHYAQLLTEQIGLPPDLKKAQQLAQTIGMQIRIEGPGISFASSPEAPPLSSLNSISHRGIWNAEQKLGCSKGLVFSHVAKGNLNYLFVYPGDGLYAGNNEWLAIMAGLFLVVLLLNYLLIRWLLKPLKWLSEGVQAVQKGRLDFKVATRENDELGDLAKSFNQMTQQIQNMLKSKEQLLLDVSHELRSPITRMKVALELNSEKQTEHLKKGLRDLEFMIAELLESARLDTPQGQLQLSTVNISTLIQQVASRYQEERPGVVIKIATPHFHAPVDPKRMQMVFKNVIENAVKYSAQQEKPIEIEVTRPDNGKLAVLVHDFGDGISVEEQPNIFEPFYRVDKARLRETGGYGLGLALCRKIMRAHGGDIQVSSTPQFGTTFTLEFADH